MDADRVALPLNGPGHYRVANGLVWTRSVEVNAVAHCNLSCRACSHASPIAEISEMSADQVHADLASLSGVLRVENVRIVGGEPLLHSDLGGFVQAIKNSGISEKVTLVTNGLLLDQANTNLWKLVDKVEVSLYPLAPGVTKRIRTAANQIAGGGLRVDILEYSAFREAMSKEPSGDSTLVRQIYASCQIAHFWRCITIDNGAVYRCPQSLYKVRMGGTAFASDSRRIHELLNVEAVLAFLESEEPLAACSSCLGSAGIRIPHQQTSRRTWLAEIGHRPEDVVDQAYLTELTDSPRSPNGCMTRSPAG